MPSVTSCTYSREQPASTRDELGRWTHQIRYDVVTDGVLGHQSVIAGALSASPNNFPAYGATYSFQSDTDSNIYHYQTQVENHPTTLTRYTATAIFAPLPDDTDVTIFEPNPFLRGPTFWVDREAYNKFYDRDATGEMIVNKCNRIYDLPPEKQLHRGVLVTEFNVATLAEVIAYMNYIDAVNVSPWTVGGSVVSARVALCQDVASGPPVKQGAYTYYPLQMRFAFNADTWDEPLIERGYASYSRDSAGEIVTTSIVTGIDPGTGLAIETEIPLLGEAKAEPFNLDADGCELPPGEVAVVTNWRLYRELNFNSLPFSG